MGSEDNYVEIFRMNACLSALSQQYASGNGMKGYKVVMVEARRALSTIRSDQPDLVEKHFLHI